MGMVAYEVLYDCEELVAVNHRRWWGWIFGVQFCNT